ncbi:Acyl-CoA synthetase OS=Tsukamurella paurometabola (strain ATCC 8368 / DSM / CCUG 35730 / CIP 100753 / JCM 10117 / KCTC 9821 / NBRC 16120 / NCIMB 702349/ NCTC 13040) OX=521096 GN=Tpau_2680 PE=4 SV=1 [Tsukamurella paurometabola]|uniref:Acyl-CoA synthetase n=1 Tax=Tsukamurella paurometabola (strain ATCC 8368 / DSM 20162 / CCUG 35730 / CIP 100753 / JCM 10117 / KCTC 9821 / NBRC 16120 / NCIMB 702349 / NCTC 13040) TaxID=521096 RepID=D5USK9_TSUPD|nr:long-chain fatty acid--CoA ligase [Tsukamurella paurometabola]ADG79280.1 AMP-dependent synthetase and ligase [Tsukamurella paurometabola DSM 20162]SUP34897.1 Long-chain-fatty-acid--CoA ligase FadD15 [Tsukamurella paurometabola]
MREISVPANFTIDPDASTVDVVFDAARTDPQSVRVKRLVGQDWKPVTTKQYADEILGVAKGLIAQGVQPGDRVALVSSTRYEWPVIDFAIWAVGAVTVPVYETSSSGQIDWILQDSDAVLLIIEGPKQAAEVAELNGKLHNVKRVLQIDAAEGEQGAVAALTAEGAGVTEEQVHAGRAGVKAADLATLIYTSGTTGRPKGCELMHSNLMSEAEAILASPFGEAIRGGSNVMFLPLAHVLARAVNIACFKGGAVVGHFNDTKNLVPQFAIFKPTLILSVPRVFEKVYASAQQSAVDGGKGKIFDAAAQTAIEYSESLDKGGPGLVLKVKHAVFDKLVYGKLKAALGGNCKVAISGGAPLGARLGHFFRGVGVTVMEGYGLTESTAAITVNVEGAQKIGTVGRPLAGQGAKIAEDGEILLQGSVVFRGYWRNEEATKAALEDGWFHTGDLGSIDEDGFLSITGRKKELIVTAGGKNVSPAGLEDALRGNPLISQAMVIGDAQPFIAALITIDPEAFPQWKSANGKPASASVADLREDPDLKAEIDRAVAVANDTVSKAEAIKKVRILPEDFSEETGEMTPTMKVKRNVVTQKYADDIAEIYAK